MEMTRYSELKEEISRLQREADKIRKDAVKAAIQQIRSLMREYNLEFDDIDPSRKRAEKKAAKPAKGKSRKSKAGKSGSKVKPKYRSTTDDKLTWSGRGRKPKWVEAWIDAGRSLDELLIP